MAARRISLDTTTTTTTSNLLTRQLVQQVAKLATVGPARAELEINLNRPAFSCDADTLSLSQLTNLLVSISLCRCPVSDWRPLMS